MTNPRPLSYVVAYYRVSTVAQGRTGYGLDAQRAEVAKYAASHRMEIVGEYTEVESGRKNARVQLRKAIEHAAMARARLVIAKLDRLSRDAAFLMSLRDSGVEFTACDMPDANRMTVGILACVAEMEVEKIRERTKAGIAQAIKRGVKWGQHGGNRSPEHLQRMLRKSVEVRKAHWARLYARLYPFVKEARAKTSSSEKAAQLLNDKGLKGPGGGMWQLYSVNKVLKCGAPSIPTDRSA